MKRYSNQDAFGWIVLILSCFAFVACGAREGERVDSSQNYARASRFESAETSAFDKRSTPRLETATTFDSEISAFLRQSTRLFRSDGAARGLRLFSRGAREFLTLETRLTFDRPGSRQFCFRSFWASSIPSRPLFLSFLTLRN